MYYVYILKSEKFCRFYVGCTGDLKVRIKEHNSGYGCITTRILRPWKLICFKAFQSQK